MSCSDEGKQQVAEHAEVVEAKKPKMADDADAKTNHHKKEETTTSSRDINDSSRRHESSSSRHHHKSSSHHKSSGSHQRHSHSGKKEESSSSRRHSDRDRERRRSRSNERHSSKKRSHETAVKKSSRRDSSTSSSSSSSSASSRSSSSSSRRRHRRYRDDSGRRKHSDNSSRRRSRSRDNKNRYKSSSRHHDSYRRRSEERMKEATSANKYMPKVLPVPPVLPAPVSASTETPNNVPTAASTTSEFLKSLQIPKELISDPVEAAKYQMEQLKKKAEELTGVKVPSFYNATAINPLVYAEQQRKRKLLWSKAKDNENTTTKIVGKAIVEGQDEKTAEKFRKLMGIKDSPSDANSTGNADSGGSSPNGSIDQIQRMQKQAFDALDKEYAFARMATHTHRGMGLGFATQGYAASSSTSTQPAPK